jgi:uncharacterized LabA/DUF88 family protein
MEGILETEELMLCTEEPSGDLGTAEEEVTDSKAVAGDMDILMGMDMATLTAATGEVIILNGDIVLMEIIIE